MHSVRLDLLPPGVTRLGIFRKDGNISGIVQLQIQVAQVILQETHRSPFGKNIVQLPRLNTDGPN